MGKLADRPCGQLLSLWAHAENPHPFSVSAPMRPLGLEAQAMPDESKLVAEEVAKAAADRARAAGVEAETNVQHGQAADVLIEGAANAELLVVGSRGHGGFAGLLLGSVSAQCAHHALCTLVIVREGCKA